MAIAQFLDLMPRKSKLGPFTFVQPLSSLLSGTRDRDSLLQPLHPSFYDFLTDATRSQRHYINLKVQSAALAAPCLDIIILGLTQDDVCGVGDPFYRNKQIPDHIVEQAIPEALRYACRFVVDHIVDVDADTIGLGEKIRMFLFQHLLRWIEALSLMKMLHVAHHSLRRLEWWIKVRFINHQ
jgi:hypothetical protein